MKLIVCALPILLAFTWTEAIAKPTHFDGDLTFDVPDSWKSETPSSNMRKGQWKIGEAEAVLYYFGKGQGGTTEQNLERWVDQWRGDKDAKPSPKVDKKTVGSATVTRVEIAGRYVAAVKPGAEEKLDKPGYHMLAAIIESPEGPHFLKLIGPEKLVVKETKAFDKLLSSIVLGSKP